MFCGFSVRDCRSFRQAVQKTREATDECHVHRLKISGFLFTTVQGESDRLVCEGVAYLCLRRRQSLSFCGPTDPILYSVRLNLAIHDLSAF